MPQHPICTSQPRRAIRRGTFSRAKVARPTRPFSARRSKRQASQLRPKVPRRCACLQKCCRKSAVQTRVPIGVVLLLLGAGASVASSAQTRVSAAAPERKCADYIVIDSRGSGERGGLSSPGAVFYPTFRAAVLSHERSAKVAVIPNGYPAWGSVPTMISALAKLPQRYHQSVVEGKKWLSGQIGTLLTNCPDSKLVLTGYSQGAQVTGDVYQNASSKRIIGVVLFGDPKFNSADPAARGGKNGGMSHTAGASL